MRNAVLGSVLFLAACGGGRASNAPDLLPPEVTLEQIGVKNLGLVGGTLDAKVSIRNPNSATIRGTGIVLSLDVQGHRFGTTEWMRGFELTGDSTVTFTVPVDFTWRTAGMAARNVLNYGDVRYTISGRTFILLSGTTWRFPYAREGSVPLVRVP
jgi:late embryogenesis abundant protein